MAAAHRPKAQHVWPAFRVLARLGDHACGEQSCLTALVHRCPERLPIILKRGPDYHESTHLQGPRSWAVPGSNQATSCL